MPRTLWRTAQSRSAGAFSNRRKRRRSSLKHFSRRSFVTQSAGRLPTLNSHHVLYQPHCCGSYLPVTVNKLKVRERTIKGVMGANFPQIDDDDQSEPATRLTHLAHSTWVRKLFFFFSLSFDT